MRAFTVTAAVVLSPIVGGMTLMLAAPTPAFAASTVLRPGDTLSAVAVRYHTTIAALVSANHIADPNRVVAGTTLQIPVPGKAAPVAPALPSATVVVRPGDTLTAIAARYHTTVTALVATNHLANPNRVLAGTTLRLPAPTLPPGWGPGGPLPAALLAHPERLALRPAFLQAAASSGIAPSVLEALCWWESGWQATALSSSGAIGLCQIEPSTVTYARTVLLHEPALDPRVPADNIAMAAAYLHDLTVRAGGDLRTAVAAYYQGLGSVRTAGTMPSTKTYVTGVFNYTAVFAAAG